MTARGFFLSFAILLIAYSPVALAQGTYTQVDFPGALDTACIGINEAGDITGFYIDSMDIYHGFLLRGGTYSTIDYPGALSTSLYRTNDVGQIVGVGDYTGFMYDENSMTFTEVNYPGSDTTYPTSINNAKTIAGYFTSNGVFSRGFELVGSTYRSLPPQNANVYVWGITGMGELVGYGQLHGLFDFSFDHGRYQTITIPNANLVQIYGVNKAGTALVGQYNSGAGFLYQNGTLQPLRFPGGGLTYAYDVNNAGEVVGIFLDTGVIQHEHCFTWVPQANAANR